MHCLMQQPHAKDMCRHMAPDSLRMQPRIWFFTKNRESVRYALSLEKGKA